MNLTRKGLTDEFNTLSASRLSHVMNLEGDTTCK